MTWQEIWFVVGMPLAAVLTGIGTFIIIKLDERPKRKKT